MVWEFSLMCVASCACLKVFESNVGQFVHIHCSLRRSGAIDL